MTKERAEKIIEKNIDRSVREYQYQDSEYDDEDYDDDKNQYSD